MRPAGQDLQVTPEVVHRADRIVEFVGVDQPDPEMHVRGLGGAVQRGFVGVDRTAVVLRGLLLFGLVQDCARCACRRAIYRNPANPHTTRTRSGGEADERFEVPVTGSGIRWLLIVV